MSLLQCSMVLASDDLKSVRDKLKAEVDFGAFVAEADKGGGMVGSARLNWPTSREQELGLSIVLIERGAEDPDWFLRFAHDYYYGGREYFDSIRKIITSVIIPFSRDFATHVEQNVESVRPSVYD